jgi:hypothetical protein
MPTPNMLPLEAKQSPKTPDDRAPTSARERRESEKFITDWKQEKRRLSHALAQMTFDVSAMTGPKWAYRFIIAVNPFVEDSSLLFYGAGFASLLALPKTPNYSVPMVAQLPERYVSVFTNGCIASTFSGAAVRMHGTVQREDGRQELYRAAFIRLSLDASRLRQFALGAFNYRVAERPKGGRKRSNARPSPPAKRSR